MKIQNAYCLLIEEGEPSNFQEALKNSYFFKYMTIMHEEMEALQRNKTWELVKLSKGQKDIGKK